MKTLLLIVRCTALVILVVATGYAIDRWVVTPLRCSHAVSIGAAALDRPNQTEIQTQRAAARIRADLQDCDCLTDATVPMTLGAAAETIDDSRTAITEYQRALSIDRRPEIYFHLGLMQQQTPDRATGFENIVRACAFDPARLNDIPYDELRREAELRLQRNYGHDWMPPRPDR